MFHHDFAPLLREQLDVIAPAKVKLLVSLATYKHGAPQTVSELQRATRSDNRSTAKLLGDLQTSGHVQKVVVAGTDKRFTFYEAQDRLLVQSPICADPTWVHAMTEIVDFWFSTVHRSVAQGFVKGRVAEMVDLCESDSDETSVLVEKYNQTLLRSEQDPVTTINSLALLRSMPGYPSRLENSIRGAVWQLTRIVIREWANSEGVVTRDLNAVTDAARPDFTLALLWSSVAMPSDVLAAYDCGYEPHFAGILRGITVHPELFARVCNELAQTLGQRENTSCHADQSRRCPTKW
jgi:hypothetical protein